MPGLSGLQPSKLPVQTGTMIPTCAEYSLMRYIEIGSKTHVDANVLLIISSLAENILFCSVPFRFTRL
jgi:hypothetical protein